MSTVHTVGPYYTARHDRDNRFVVLGEAPQQWTVPAGAPDGKYWVRIEYWSFEAGNEANAEVTFYVYTCTAVIRPLGSDSPGAQGPEINLTYTST